MSVYLLFGKIQVRDTVKAKIVNLYCKKIEIIKKALVLYTKCAENINLATDPEKRHTGLVM